MKAPGGTYEHTWVHMYVHMGICVCTWGICGHTWVVCVNKLHCAAYDVQH